MPVIHPRKRLEKKFCFDFDFLLLSFDEEEEKILTLREKNIQKSLHTFLISQVKNRFRSNKLKFLYKIQAIKS
jgi:hypothetical protein